MAHNAPMWWFKEVPVQPETFVDTQHSVTHVVPFPQHIQSYPYTEQDLAAFASRTYANQGGVFAFPNQYAKSVVWRTKENASTIELVSITSKENTPTRQISFRFHAPILPGIHVAPATPAGGMCITLLTVDSILYRLEIANLSRFATSDAPEGYTSAAHIKWSNHGEPVLFKYVGDRQGAVISSDGSLFLVKTALLAEDAARHEHAEVKVYDLQDDSHLINKIQHASTLQHLYSKLHSVIESKLPVPAGFPDTKTCMEIVALESFATQEDTLLFALYQDRTIRVWSTGRRQCLQTMRVHPSPNESGFVQETIDASSRSKIGIMFNPFMPWVVRLLVYIPTGSDAQLSLFTARLDTTEDVEFIPGATSVLRSDTAAGPGSNKTSLISMVITLNASQTGYTVWGLWESSTRVQVQYMHIDDPESERAQFQQFAKRDLLAGRWWTVSMQAPPSGFIKSMSSIEDSFEATSSYFEDYVFTSGRFSDRTISRALKAFIPDHTLASNVDLQAQVTEALAVKSPKNASRQHKEQQRQDEILAWTKFISTCARIDHVASTPLQLSVAPDTGYVVIVKQDSLSFLTACDDSEILYHTFQDKQSDIANFIATPSSQIRNTYPKIQDQTLRQGIAKVFRAMEFLTRNISDRTSKRLEGAIARLSASNGPRSFIEVFSRDYVDHIVSKADKNRARNLISSCEEPKDVIRQIIAQLLDKADCSPSGLTSSRFILPYEALVAASLQQLAGCRYTIAQNLIVLLVVLFTAPPSTRQRVQEESPLMSDAMRATQSLLVLKWLSTQSVASTSNSTAAQGIEQQLSQMHVQDPSSASGSKLSTTLSYRQSLTGSLLRSIGSDNKKYGSVEFPIYLAIPRAVSKLLYGLGVLNQEAVEESKYHAALAQKLSELGEMALLSRFLDMVPVSSSLAYYRGRVLLSEGKPELAMIQFMTVMTCFGNDIKAVEQELDIMAREYPTSKYNRGQAKPEDYYTHLISLFSAKKAHDQVIQVSKLALSEQGSTPKTTISEKQVRILQGHIFTSAVAIGSYDVAYNAMMHIPGDKLRKEYLSALVTAMCSKGDGAKLSLFAFTGMQEEVERMLCINAQQSAVLSHPDYYKILYAYYSYRGDFRSAAAIMCQYARRLCDGTNPSEEVSTLLAEAAVSYLAAINALHLAGPKSAWVAIPPKEWELQRAKRRKLGVAGTDKSTFGDVQSVGEASCQRDIVYLSDIKKEYALTVGKLKLIKAIPNHVLAAAMMMDARNTEVMLVQCGDYDEATSLALLYDLDLDVVFDFLVDKYLGALAVERDELLGKGGLYGASQSKTLQTDRTRSTAALLELQKYLDRHDSAKTNHRYRLGVVEKVLMKNADFHLQPWLTEHYLTHNPEDLIRLYLQYGALEKAAKFSSKTIQLAMKKEELISRHPNARWLPYSLLDEIFKSLAEEITQLGSRLQVAATAKNVLGVTNGFSRSESTQPTKRSAKAEEKRLETLKEIQRQLEEDMQLYLENVERESIF